MPGGAIIFIAAITGVLSLIVGVSELKTLN